MTSCQRVVAASNVLLHVQNLPRDDYTARVSKAFFDRTGTPQMCINLFGDFSYKVITYYLRILGFVTCLLKLHIKPSRQ